MAGMILKFHSIPNFLNFHRILGKFVSNLQIPGPKNVESNFHAINHHLDFFNISYINSSYN